MFSLKKFLLWVFFIWMLSVSSLILLIKYSSLMNADYNYEIISGNFKQNWHDYGNMEVELDRNSFGGVISADLFKEYRKSLYKEYGYDAVLSDQISVNRTVPDVRPKDCQNMKYLAQLPKVAIIIIFYNERLSVLLRTVHGIINRTPEELIQEIILVDDCSTYSELHSPLADYLRFHLPTERSKVRLVRTPQRSGLIVARMTGARAASKESEVLIFLDSHIEVNYNWLPPLLEPIASNPKACTCPALDMISADKVNYEKVDPSRGYFDWDLSFLLFTLQPHEYRTPAKNRREYILMGAAIAINTKFFWDLGGFDEGMKLWGGEQLELSFKVWMCGGEIIHIPCSRMGHLFRDPNTKGNTNLYGNYSFLSRNLRRLVNVWMDKEHRQYVFNRRPSIKESDPGNLTERFAIRERLKCKSFSWLLDTIMPDLKEEFPPIEPYDLATGLLRSVFEPNLCVALADGKTILLESCIANDTIAGSKYWTYTYHGKIHTYNYICLCADFGNKAVNSWPCYEAGLNQKWYYDRARQWIVGLDSNMCISHSMEDKLLKLKICDSNDLTMKWSFSFMNQTEMDKWDSKLSKSFKI